MDEVGDVDDFGDNLDIGVASDEETLDQSSDLDPEIEEIRARLKEMEKEAQLIRNLHTEVEKQMSTVLNECTFYFFNFLCAWLFVFQHQQHHHHLLPMKKLKRILVQFLLEIFAYIEFADKESARASLAMSDTLFRGRQIKVVEKRTNRPGMGFNRRRMRGRVAYRYLYSNRRLRYRRGASYSPY
ncbi:Polyadenylate-binding protein 2 [Trichinella sp. T8]|nr:Polyadenylate-binding protein 2 [Trichinella sp. T8]